MSLRFFADHCIPNSVIKVLIEHGYDVIKLKDVLPTDSPDLRENCFFLSHIE